MRRAEKNNSPELMRYVEKQVLLQTLDHLWREHLVVLDHLRQVIGWRGMAQRDPLNEYKSEAFELFDALITRLREMVTAQLMRVEVAHERPPEPQLPPMQASHFDPRPARMNWRLRRSTPTSRPANSRRWRWPAARAGADRDPNNPEGWGRVGRNEPARADRARNSSIATACWPDGRGSIANARTQGAGPDGDDRARRRKSRRVARSRGRARPGRGRTSLFLSRPKGITLAAGDFVKVSLGTREAFGVVWALAPTARDNLKTIVAAPRLAAPAGKTSRLSRLGRGLDARPERAWCCAWPTRAARRSRGRAGRASDCARPAPRRNG